MCVCVCVCKLYFISSECNDHVSAMVIKSAITMFTVMVYGKEDPRFFRFRYNRIIENHSRSYIMVPSHRRFLLPTGLPHYNGTGPDLSRSSLWAPAQRKRATMLYFANVFLIYFFMAALFSGPG